MCVISSYPDGRADDGLRSGHELGGGCEGMGVSGGVWGWGGREEEFAESSFHESV